jgi:DNA-binding beta-propeller fold protein YncE
MIFVTDPKNKNIQVFDLSGNFISSFVPSHANLKYPSEIAISEDRIFLTDTTRAGIFIYDLDGGPIAEFGSKGDGEKELEISNDLLIYGNNLLVVDGENNRIQVFDLEGNYLRMFGEFVPENPNKSVEKNEAPNSIAYSNNKFYVGYTGAYNVKTYDATEIGIPDWIKTNAGWWADGQIPDSAFIDGIEYLIKQEVIVVQNFYEIQSENDSTIPLWVKTNAGWWADGQIPDSAFIDGIEYLIKHGIIKIDLTMEPKPAY